MWLAVAKFIVSLLISYTVQEIFAPTLPTKRDDENKDTLDQEDIPSAEIGKTIPKVYGTRWVTSPNVVYWRKTKEETVDKVYIKYWVNLHLAVCYAPVTSLTKFTMDKKITVIPSLLTLSEITLSNPSKQLLLTVEYPSSASGTYEIPTLADGTLPQVSYTTFPETAMETYGGANNEFGSLWSQAVNDDWDISKPGKLVLYYITGADTPTPTKLNVWESTDSDLALLPAHPHNNQYAITTISGTDKGTVYLKLRLIVDTAPVDGKYTPIFKIATLTRNHRLGYDTENDTTTDEYQYIEFSENDVYVPITPDTPQVATLDNGCTSLNIPKLFGGYKKGGGLVGQLCVVNGDVNPTSETSSALKTLYKDQLHSNYKLLDGEDASQMESPYAPMYPSVVSVILLDTYITANRSHIAPMHFLVKDVTFKSLVGILPENLRIIGNDANPAAIILDLLLNPVYGKGLPLDRIDIPSFIKAANTLLQEELAMSVVFAGTKEVEELINIVCRHSFGTWRIKENKIQFILYRAYEGLLESIPVANPFKILSLRANKGTDGLANRVKIKWTETGDTQDISRVETVSAPLALSDLDKYSTNNYTYKGCPTKKAAKVLGELHLLADKYVLKIAEWEEPITETRYLVGDFVKLPANKFEDSSLVLRVTNIKIKGTKRVVTALEDSFQNKLIDGSLPSTPFISTIKVDLSKGSLKNVGIPLAKHSTPTVFFSSNNGQNVIQEGDWFTIEITNQGVKLSVDKAKIPTGAVNGSLIKGLKAKTLDSAELSLSITFQFSHNQITPETPNNPDVIIVNAKGVVTN